MASVVRATSSGEADAFQFAFRARKSPNVETTFVTTEDAEAILFKKEKVVSAYVVPVDSRVSAGVGPV